MRRLDNTERDILKKRYGKKGESEGPDVPVYEFNVGDTVDVHVRIKEGERERVQVYTGTVIAKKGGGGNPTDTFTVRRIVQGQGVERVFPLHSPNVLKVKVRREGVVRRAKLYFLRDRVGKGTRVKGREQVRGGKRAKGAKPAPAEKPAEIVENETPAVPDENGNAE